MMDLFQEAWAQRLGLLISRGRPLSFRSLDHAILEAFQSRILLSPQLLNPFVESLPEKGIVGVVTPQEFPGNPSLFHVHLDPI